VIGGLKPFTAYYFAVCSGTLEARCGAFSLEKMGRTAEGREYCFIFILNLLLLCLRQFQKLPISFYTDSQVIQVRNYVLVLIFVFFLFLFIDCLLIYLMIYHEIF